MTNIEEYKNHIKELLKILVNEVDLENNNDSLINLIKLINEFDIKSTKYFEE